jgi:hypothetical protein
VNVDHSIINFDRFEEFVCDTFTIYRKLEKEITPIIDVDRERLNGEIERRKIGCNRKLIKSSGRERDRQDL